MSFLFLTVLSLLVCVCLVDSLMPLSGWTQGRSTYYTTWEQGDCNYGTISTTGFPYNNIAAPNTAFYNDSYSCGACYEVMCLDVWDSSYCSSGMGCKSANASVIIEVTDECPEESNQEWCSGDIDHFDLSENAFELIADKECGVIKMQFRQVACEFTDEENIIITTHSGSNAWYYGLTVSNVDYYGAINKVFLKDSGSTNGKYVEGDRMGYNVFLWQVGGSGLQTPFSINIIDSHGRSLTTEDLVTSTTGGQSYDFGKQFGNDTISKKYWKNKTNKKKTKIQ